MTTGSKFRTRRIGNNWSVSVRGTLGEAPSHTAV